MYPILQFANATATEGTANASSGDWKEAFPSDPNRAGVNIYADGSEGLGIYFGGSPGTSAKPMSIVPAGTDRAYMQQGTRIWVRSLTASPTTYVATRLG